MRSLALAVALLAGCTADDPAETDDTDVVDTDEPIEAGTETVTTTWDVDLFSHYQSPTIQRFDTMGGRRKLDAMTIAVDHTAVMDLVVENGSTFPLYAEDYTMEFYLQSIIQIGVEEEPPEDGEQGPPFFGPGAFIGQIAVDLAATDGDPLTTEDQHGEVVTDTIQFEALYDWAETPHFMETMTGEDEIQLVVGGFSETWVYWHNEYGGEALLFAGANGVQYSGSMTVTFEYSPTDE